ncbi:MAG: VanZ family protein [Solirubrobacterales bacterium]
MAIEYYFEKEILFIFGIPIYMIIKCIIVLRKKKKGNQIHIKKEFIKFVFALYVFLLIGFTLFPIEIIFDRNYIFNNIMAVNYIPFLSIAKDVGEVGHGNWSTSFQLMLLFRNVGGNFVLLMPLGILIPLLSNKLNSIKKALMLGFIISFFIEMFQYFEDYFHLGFRTVDVDDIILNTLGAAAGYLIYVFTTKVFLKYKTETRILE